MSIVASRLIEENAKLRDLAHTLRKELKWMAGRYDAIIPKVPRERIAATLTRAKRELAE